MGLYVDLGRCNEKEGLGYYGFPEAVFRSGVVDPDYLLSVEAPGRSMRLFHDRDTTQPVKHFRTTP